MRENAHRYIRPDVWRYMAAGAPRYYGKDVFRYFEDGTRPNRANFSGRVLERKFDPDQPRAPAGTPEGGQWMSGGSGSSKGPADPNKIKQDVRSEQPWEVIKTLHWPDGSVSQQTILNHDGSVIRADFANPSAIGNWDSRYAVLMPDGSLTAFQNTGLEQAIVDANGKILSSSIWTGTGPESQAILQPAFLGPAAPAAAEKAMEAALALYTWLSAQNDAANQAVVAFRANLFRPGPTKGDVAIWVGSLSKEQVEKACPRFAEVQSILNEAVASTDRGAYESAAAYGTAVHRKIEEEVNGVPTVPPSPPRDYNFRAEVSLIKSSEVPRNSLGSKRLDILENPQTRTVCVHDPKTGEAKLTLPRALEIASTVSYFYPDTEQIVVTEVKPVKPND
jgi:hypothetical protein